MALSSSAASAAPPASDAGARRRAGGVEHALAATARRLAAGGRLVFVEGAGAPGAPPVLALLAGRLASGFVPVSVRGAPAAPDALPLRILGGLGEPSRERPYEAVERCAASLRAGGRALVVLVDDADALGREALSWLISRAYDPAWNLRAVFAARDDAAFRAALAGSGCCVGLVRLPDAPALALAPRAEPSEPPPGPVADAAASTARLLSVEELLDGSEPASAAGLPAPAARPAAGASAPSPQRVAGAKPAAAPSGADGGRASPVVRARRAAAALAALVGVAAGLAAFERTGPEPDGAARVASAGAGAPPAAARAPGSADAAAPTGRAAPAQGAAPVADLARALDLVASDSADGREAALAFLRRHGPDAEGYEFLERLDAQRADDADEVLAILGARARVRTALCAAWADDALGEAAGRLGCPGAELARR